MSTIPPVAPAPSDRRPEADDAARRRVGRLLVWQSATLLGMLLAFTLVLPWKLLVLALALAALVLGVLVLWRSRRVSGTLVPRAAAGAGMALALVGLTAGLLPLAAWDETVRLEQCAASALTVRAQHECTQEFTRQVEERTGVAQLGG